MPGRGAKDSLEVVQAQRRAAQFSADRISPPPSRALHKVVRWVLGGFGSSRLPANIVYFVAWYGLSHLPFYSLLLSGPVSSERPMKPGSQEASVGLHP